jgi:hypothetical protein
MSGKCLATAAAFCVLATPVAFAQNATPPRPAAVSAPAAQPADWPILLSKKTAAEAPGTAWTQQEIELAQARCAALLRNLPVVTVPEAPIREGAECGAPAPVKLVSVGRSPQVALSPPPTVTCDMVATLYRWLERDVQPLARKSLGAPVIRIETMSSYSCRNAYGRRGGRLSEHGKANAVDISAFVTASGQKTMVLADWGPTQRQIAAQAAAAKAQADQAQAGAIVPLRNVQQASRPVQRPLESAPVAATVVRPGLSIDVPGVTVLLPQHGADTLMGFAPPNRLGGPKETMDPGARMDFLRAAHDTACKEFNTVLGPEANSAHRNHFHVDMAERIKNTKICE